MFSVWGVIFWKNEAPSPSFVVAALSGVCLYLSESFLEHLCLQEASEHPSLVMPTCPEMEARCGLNCLGPPYSRLPRSQMLNRGGKMELPVSLR